GRARARAAHAELLGPAGVPARAAVVVAVHDVGAHATAHLTGRLARAAAARARLDPGARGAAAAAVGSVARDVDARRRSILGRAAHARCRTRVGARPVATLLGREAARAAVTAGGRVAREIHARRPAARGSARAARRAAGALEARLAGVARDPAAAAVRGVRARIDAGSVALDHAR